MVTFSSRNTNICKFAIFVRLCFPCFTNFSMLFLTVVKDFVRFYYIESKSNMQIAYLVIPKMSYPGLHSPHWASEVGVQFLICSSFSTQSLHDLHEVWSCESEYDKPSTHALHPTVTFLLRNEPHCG